MNGFRMFLASIRFSGTRFDAYYGKLLSDNDGQPTADEAKKDVASRDRLMNTTSVAVIR